MINARAKGQRTFRKAVRFALSYPEVVVIPLYQVSRWAQPQPFDMLVFRPACVLILVEVRSNTWGTSKTQTVQLTRLPGLYYQRQIWMFKDHSTIPLIREWELYSWNRKETPWP